MIENIPMLVIVGEIKACCESIEELGGVADIVIEVDVNILSIKPKLYNHRTTLDNICQKIWLLK